MKHFLLAGLAAVTLSACASTDRTTLEQEAHFWERQEGVSALYLRGPKAQHQLNHDIAACVSEVKELTRLGTIRDANPPGGIRMHQGLATGWQSPTRDGPLYTEFRDFSDFESCMAFKGWKRTSYVRPEQVEQSRTNYKTVILGETVGLKSKDADKKADEPKYND